MAIVYIQRPESNKYLLSGNNHIIELKDDDTNRDLLYAEFTVSGETPSRVYADIDRVVWYNLLGNVSSRLNDYTDTTDASTIVASDFNTFFQDWSKIALTYTIDITLTFTNGDTVSDTMTLEFLGGVEQEINYFRGITPSNKNTRLLSPLKDNTANTYYIKYWDGYPMDIGFTSDAVTGSNINTITNESTQMTSPTFTVNNRVTRLYLSSGTIGVTIDNYLPLGYGVNKLRFDDDNILEVDKVTGCTGVYIKWFNNDGGFNYWLFEDFSIDSRSRSNGSINGNQYAIYEQVRKSVSLGRNQNNTLSCNYDTLTHDEMTVLSGLFVSPQVYLYMGDLHSPQTGNNWLGIGISSGNFNQVNYKGKVGNGTIRFSLPDSNTLTL